MIYDAFLFDFDGTLVDTCLMHQRAIKTAAAKWGVSIADHEVNFLVGLPMVEAAAYVKSLSLTSFCEIKFMKEKIKIFKNFAEKEKSRLLPGVEDIFRFCDCYSLLRGLVTNANLQNELLPVLNNLESGSLTISMFDTVVTGDCVLHRKPFPNTYQKAFESLGVDGHRCVAFEDSQAGVLAAHRAGCFVVGLASFSGKQSSLLEVGAHATVSSLVEAVNSKPWLQSSVRNFSDSG